LAEEEHTNKQRMRSLAHRLTIAAFEPLVFSVLGFFVVLEYERERERDENFRGTGAGGGVAVREALYDNGRWVGSQRRLIF
jgi:hypothetical protein